MEPVGEFSPCFLRVVARFSVHADPNTLSHDEVNHGTGNFQSCELYTTGKLLASVRD
jgi:hypothetical protein